MASYSDAAPVGMIDQLLTMAWAMRLHDRPNLDREAMGEELDSDELPALSRDVSLCLKLSTADTKGPAGGEPPDWMRLWSYAEHDLRIPEERFWMLTPRQFAALSERHEEAYIRSLNGAAMVTATLANINRDKEKHPAPFTIEDFLPKLLSKAPERADKVKAAKDLRKYSQNLFASMGGRTVKVVPKKLELVKRRG